MVLSYPCGSLRFSGTVGKSGSLVVCGAIKLGGSLVQCDSFEHRGSLLVYVAILWNGSLRSVGTFRKLGSLFYRWYLSDCLVHSHRMILSYANGSLSGIGTV